MALLLPALGVMFLVISTYPENYDTEAQSMDWTSARTDLEQWAGATTHEPLLGLLGALLAIAIAVSATPLPSPRPKGRREVYRVMSVHSWLNGLFISAVITAGSIMALSMAALAGFREGLVDGVDFLLYLVASILSVLIVASIDNHAVLEIDRLLKPVVRSEGRAARSLLEQGNRPPTPLAPRSMRSRVTGVSRWLASMATTAARAVINLAAPIWRTILIPAGNGRRSQRVAAYMTWPSLVSLPLVAITVARPETLLVLSLGAALAYTALGWIWALFWYGALFRLGGAVAAAWSRQWTVFGEIGLLAIAVLGPAAAFLAWTVPILPLFDSCRGYSCVGPYEMLAADLLAVVGAGIACWPLGRRLESQGFYSRRLRPGPWAATAGLTDLAAEEGVEP